MCVLLQDTTSFDYIAFLGTWEAEQWQVFWLPKVTTQAVISWLTQPSTFPRRALLLLVSSVQ